MTTERERFDSWLSQFRELAPLHGPVLWEAWQAALSAPPGYVLVPVEPTPEMIAADLASAICHNQSYAGRPMEVADLLAGIRACWSAMIAAAPKEPT